MQNEEWGPYRIEERLGTGGMGEVYRAYDKRLDRQVALKIIRPDATTGRKARERFRREARSAAGLSHPTVLQIYDIVEREDGDGIVMELVEGETLGRILKRGPLELDRVVRWGREIAEGLAAAHGRDIIHRDLKADNVMITPEDHPKILDFGLAKRLGLSDDQSISIEGRVVGTSHAMSPEQAQGFEVDHRSDLFSFGTLLYEMVTGQSPFRRPALAETLTRVCVHRQTPVQDLRPEVPAELAELIDQLLEKKPDDRPQEAREVVQALRHMEPAVSATMNPVSYPTMVDMPRATATGSMVSIPPTDSTEATTRGLTGNRAEKRTGGTGDVTGSETLWFRTVTLVKRRPVAWGSGLAVLVLAGLALVLMSPSAPPAIYVAATAPEVAASSTLSEPSLVAAGIRVAVLQSLIDLESVIPLAPDQVDGIEGSSQEVARAVAADEVVTSQVECVGLSCHVTLHRVGVRGQLLATKSYKLASDDLLLAGEASMDNARALFPEYRSLRTSDGLRVSSEDYERYLRLQEASIRRAEGTTVEDLLRQVAELRDSSPEFMPIYLLEATLSRDRYLESRNPEDLDRAFEAIEEARELAPRDPRPVSTLVLIALDVKKLDRAEEALGELEKLAPNADRLLAQKAMLLEAQGQGDEALARMREAYERRPSRHNLLNLAQLEYRLGEVSAARNHLESLLKTYPSHFQGLYLLATLELLSGDPVRAVDLFRELLEQSPGSGVLTNLSLAHMVAGQYPQAAETARRAFELDAQSPMNVLNYADALLLVGRSQAANDLYEKVLELTGDPSAQTDPQVLTVAGQAYAHLERDREAVRTVQEALRLAPESPQVAFEAALVYTLVGDKTSALLNAEKSLDLGFDAGWYRLPWFEPLYSMEEFSAMVDPEQVAIAENPSEVSTGP